MTPRESRELLRCARRSMAGMGLPLNIPVQMVEGCAPPHLEGEPSSNEGRRYIPATRRIEVGADWRPEGWTGVRPVGRPPKKNDPAT